MNNTLEALYFANLSLIAILTTVYILAVTLIGKAILISSYAEKSRLEMEKLNTEKEIAEKQLNQVTDYEKLIKILKAKRSRLVKDIKHVQQIPKLLSLSGGFLPSFLLFLISTITILLLQQFNVDVGKIWWGYYIIIIGALVVGIWRMYFMLSALQFVSVELVPEVEIKIDTPTPIKVKKGDSINLDFLEHLLKGDYIDMVDNNIMCPHGFSVTSDYAYKREFQTDAVYQPNKTQYCVYRNTYMAYGTFSKVKIQLKCEADIGKYSLQYCLTCRQLGVVKLFVEIEVVA